MTTTMTHDTAVHNSSRRAPLLRRLGQDTAYVLVGFPLGIATFVLAVTGLSLGAGLLITLAGLPALVITLSGARGFAALERARMAGVARQPPIVVAYRSAPSGSAWWRRMVTVLTDAQAWLDLLHAIVRFPISVAAFVVVITWWAAATGGLTYWFWQRWLPVSPGNNDLPELLGLGDTTATRIWFYTLLGVACAITLPWAVRLCALAEAALARGLLFHVAELRQRGFAAQHREPPL